jgi:hypothetical protein
VPISDAVLSLASDLRDVFGRRLQSLVAYGRADRSSDAPAPTLALVESLSSDDLRACADRVGAWHEAGLATPLILGTVEFGRSLDAFPFEFGAILADHVVVHGADPFAGLRVEAGDLRRACEIQARSHLLHLRQGYIETRGRSDSLVELIVRSAAPLAALLRNLARLDGSSPAEGVLARVAQLEQGRALSADEARRTLPEYVKALEHLTNTIDRWSAT